MCGRNMSDGYNNLNKTNTITLIKLSPPPSVFVNTIYLYDLAFGTQSGCSEGAAAQLGQDSIVDVFKS